MREKVLLSDLNILFVCLDLTSGTNTNRVSNDMATFRNIGCNTHIICHPGSAIDAFADSQGIRRHHLHSLQGWRVEVELWRLMREVLLTEPLDLVHCYNYRPLLALGFALKRNIRVPLVYTSNENIRQLYRPFWHDYCVTRVDQVLCYSSSWRDLLAETLPLGPRRISYTGAGLDFRSVALSAHGPGQWKLCTYIPPFEKDLEKLIPLFLALPLLKDLDRPVVLSLMTTGSWYSHPNYDQLKRAILERGLENLISFHPKSWGAEALASQHLFLGLPSEAPFEDYEVMALLSQVPLVLPRTGTRSELLAHGERGYSYMPGDVHELRTKVTLALKRYNALRDTIEQHLPELREIHHFDHYAETLFRIYERLILQRLRFAIKRNKASASRG